MLIRIKSKWINSNMMKLTDGGGVDGKMKKKPCNRGDANLGGLMNNSLARKRLRDNCFDLWQRREQID